jgi:hypothetical protein
MIPDFPEMEKTQVTVRGSRHIERDSQTDRYTDTLVDIDLCRDCTSKLPEDYLHAPQVH